MKQRSNNNLQYNYNRKRLGHEASDLFPQSPEWHLTTFELEAMEAERSNQAGGSGTTGQDTAMTDVPTGHGASGGRPNPGDQVQHLSDPGLPSVMDNKDLMSLSPSMMHLPPLTLKNISNETLEMDPSAELLDNNSGDEALDTQAQTSTVFFFE
ncbi:hypothetical protein BGZ70_007643 [Mortierella alpina]|uniref:Uncharacterized protein n=1 Tax=Mortierella alpina TaxID=64518 RepID=A0A9P6M2F4_MORAP|nr:hypothetical protein BGZ70_007643 [Mortierella alpina]